MGTTVESGSGSWSIWPGESPKSKEPEQPIEIQLVPASSSVDTEDEPTNERGSIMTLKERQEAMRPTAMRHNSSALQGEVMKTELEGALAEEGLVDLTDTLWAMGIRKPRQLAHLDWEDLSDEGITKVQFKVLQHVGTTTALPPPMPGYERAKGEWRESGS